MTVEIPIWIYVICPVGYLLFYLSEAIGKSTQLRPTYVLEFLSQFFIAGWQGVQADLPEPIRKTFDVVGPKIEQEMQDLIDGDPSKIAGQVQQLNRTLNAGAGGAPLQPSASISHEE